MLSHANEPPISSINSSTTVVNPAVDTNYSHPKSVQKIVRPHRPPPPPPSPGASTNSEPAAQPPLTKPPPPPTKPELKEPTVTHRKSVSFDLHEDTHGFDTALHHARAAFAGPSPTPDLKGILRASSPSSSFTNRSNSSTPEAVQQQPQRVVANIDSDPDLDSETDSDTDTDASDEGLAHGAEEAAQSQANERTGSADHNQIRRAEVVRNQAARKLHEEFGQGDLVEYEHDSVTNTIREVVVGGVVPSSTRHPERVEVLPAKYETLPIKRTAQFVHENTPNNLLVPDEVHRQVLLEENEVRNKLLAQYAHEQQQHPQQQLHHQQVYTMHHAHSSELVGRVPSPYLYDTGSASVSPLPATSQYIPAGVYDPHHHQHLAKLAPPPLPDIGYHHLPQIYPPVQILPVHYTKLPTPQHTIYTYASGSVPVSHAPIVSLAPASQPSLPYHLPYSGIPTRVGAATGTYVSSAHPSATTAATHVLMPVSDSIRLLSAPRSTAPEHTSHTTPSHLSPPLGPKTPKSVSDKKRFFENAMEDQQKPTPKSDKVFSFLSQDEVEKLKQEEERKIATLGKEQVHRRYGAGDDEDDDRSDSGECDQTGDKSDINDNNMRYVLE
uniref:Uncharacterized protein n=1 Tax=Anopheles culicifacies TaxID=139723 RepID=A0A182M4H0_9DIPT